MLSWLQARIARRFRALLCGDPSGDPPWLDAIASGEGPGFYSPNEAPWIVHGDMATLVGGIRALLVQALHPGSLTGVRDHSRYHSDPLGRLAGTIQWLTITTFASRESIEREASRVKAMHRKVRGEYQNSSGQQKTYRASDPELLKWVHIAFMESFLRCHQSYSNVPIPGGADAYIHLWARSVKPLGLSDAPMNERELLEEIARFENQLIVSEETHEVIQWLRNPPLPPIAKLAYRLLFQAAFVTLPDNFREMTGLRAAPRWIIVPSTRWMLRILRILIGPENPIQDTALARIRRYNESSTE